MPRSRTHRSSLLESRMLGHTVGVFRMSLISRSLYHMSYDGDFLSLNSYHLNSAQWKHILEHIIFAYIFFSSAHLFELPTLVWYNNHSPCSSMYLKSTSGSGIMSNQCPVSGYITILLDQYTFSYAMSFQEKHI